MSEWDGYAESTGIQKCHFGTMFHSHIIKNISSGTSHHLKEKKQLKQVKDSRKTRVWNSCAKPKYRSTFVVFFTVITFVFDQATLLCVCPLFIDLKKAQKYTCSWKSKAYSLCAPEMKTAPAPIPFAFLPDCSVSLHFIFAALHLQSFTAPIHPSLRSAISAG